MKEFADQILQNLANNGFPQKKVSLPTEKMFEVADNKGLSLNKVLEYINENHQIEADIQTERIVFSLTQTGDDMFAQAEQMMKNMDPGELQRMKEMVDNMSPEEREQMMQQAQAMFGKK